MVMVAGIDGCRGGWIVVRRAVSRPDGEFGTADFSADFSIVDDWRNRPPAALEAVDMPIGLPDSGRRSCDLTARRLLGGKAGSRVFLDLRRPLLEFTDYADANAWAKRDGKGLSKQAWNLVPKLREIDAAITPAAQARIFEAHPELAFRQLAGATIAETKHGAAGREIRRRLLAAAGFRDLDAWLAALPKNAAGADDLFDACALALTANRRAAGAAVCLPEFPERDSHGLSMEIWY